jgi:predicted nucleic acid-binding protein
MRDRAVLDTGIIVAIYFEEDASERAVEIAYEHSPITLDLAVAEVGNAAWKRVTLFGEGKDATGKSLCKCLDFIKSCAQIGSSELAELAYEISVENKTTFYDSLFLAAAEKEKVPLYTLDKKLYEKVKTKRDVRMI